MRASPTGNHDASGTLDLIAFFNLGVLAEDDDAHLIFFQVHGDSSDVVRKAEELSRHHLVEPIDARDAVAEGNHGAHFVDRDLRFVVIDLLAQ